MIQSRVFLFGRLLKGFLPSLTGFYLVFLGDFYRFALVLLGFVKFNYISTQVLPSFGRFYLVLLGFVKFNYIATQVLPSFGRFYLILLGFIQFFGGFYLVFLDFAP